MLKNQEACEPCGLPVKAVTPMESIVSALRGNMNSLENVVEGVYGSLFTERPLCISDPEKPVAPTLRGELEELSERLQVCAKRLFGLQDRLRDELGDIRILD